MLFEPRSLKIEQNLRGLASDAEVHPEANVLCLRCHVTPDVERHVSRIVDGVRQFRLEDGVSCEVCHGPAQNWLAEHFRPGWGTLSAEARRAQGMIDTAGLEGRLHLCIDCHVGAPGTEVNHDLIAAGHPRLNFEFSSFHFLWHKHWDQGKDLDPRLGSRGRPDFEARGWALGQLATARAALEVLAARAARGPWPEFAEYDCYACHHDLKSPSSRQQAAPAGRRSGALEWNDWYYAQLDAAVIALNGRADPALGKALTSLRGEMEGGSPDRVRVAREARRAAELVGTALAQAEEAPATTLPVEAAFRHIVAVKRKSQSWDDAAQTFLALSALSRSGQLLGRPPVGLAPLHELLRFPMAYDSPREFDAARFRRELESLRSK